MSDHFAAFSFVDRITEHRTRRARAGRLSRCPRSIAAFPACLVAEAVGQLAAWVAMARIDFRGRPVAALATETIFHGEVAPGSRLELDVEIESCDDDAVAYSGAARVDGVASRSSLGIAWGRCCRCRNSMPRRQCASASSCCARRVRRASVFMACPSPGCVGLDGRGRQVGARPAAGAAVRAVLRRSLSAPPGFPGHAAARQPDPPGARPRPGGDRRRGDGAHFAAAHDPRQDALVHRARSGGRARRGARRRRCRRGQRCDFRRRLPTAAWWPPHDSMSARRTA